MATHYSKEQLALFMKYVNPVELSRACGLNGRTVRRIKKGAGDPKHMTIVKLSDFFDSQLGEIHALTEEVAVREVPRG
jgi:hypothetical protein